MGRATFQDVNTHNQHCGQRALVAYGSIVSISYMFYRIIFITSRKLQEFLTGQSLIKKIVVPHKTTPNIQWYTPRSFCHLYNFQIHQVICAGYLLQYLEPQQTLAFGCISLKFLKKLNGLREFAFTMLLFISKKCVTSVHSQYSLEGSQTPNLYS